MLYYRGIHQFFWLTHTMPRQFFIPPHQTTHWLFCVCLPFLTLSNSANATLESANPESMQTNHPEKDVQPEQVMTPATPQACLALDSNADRLSCYDTALDRQPRQASDISSILVQSEPSSFEETTAVSNLKVATDFLNELNPFNNKNNTQNHPDLSLLDRRWELSEQSKLGTFNIRANRPVYLLPAMYTSRINNLPTSPNPLNQAQTPQALEHVEAKFQLSLKTKAIEGVLGGYGDVWLGYTQVSRWQVYNDDASRPFRETNYEPEASLIFNTNYQLFGWQGRLLGLTINHQSNGRALPLSRSWNRAILNIGLEKDNWVIMLRPWYHFSEQADRDDNANIEDFTGKGEVQIVHKRNQHEYALLLRHNLESSSEAKGAMQFDWTFPVKGSLRGHVQVFDGYGESLIDYNHRATYVGLGISLSNWY